MRRSCKRVLPDLYLSLSSSIAPQIREYPRASTTAINAYTSPITEPYLRALAVRLAQRDVPNKPLIMLSSGGVIGAEVAARNPVRMIESGPAAGALAAAYYAERLGLDRLLSFDMGGTTAKACLIEDRKPLVAEQFRGRPHLPLLRRQRHAADHPLDRHDRDRRRRRQHRQASTIWACSRSGRAAPAPSRARPATAAAATEPTVTDADLVLGLLDADNFLGGDMPLDKGAAEAAIDRLGGQARHRIWRRRPAASIASSPKRWRRPRARTRPTAASIIAGCRCSLSAAQGRCMPARSASCCRARR